VYQVARANYTGTYSGTSVGGVVLVRHPDGTFIARATETFTGTIAGSAMGTATDRLVCASTVAGAVTCVFLTDHGEGGLTGLHAQLVLTHAAGATFGAFTYAGLVWFTAQHHDDEWSTTAAGTNGQAFGMPSGAPGQTNWSMTPVSGNHTVLHTIPPAITQDADGNTIIYFLFSDNFTGGISGTAVGLGIATLHTDGTAQVKSIATFTGSVLGRSGTAILHLVASGTLAASPAHFELNHGIGGLRDVVVVGTSTVSSTSPTTTYSGHVESRQ
jgi:hypothetical protein